MHILVLSKRIKGSSAIRRAGKPGNMLDQFFTFFSQVDFWKFAAIPVSSALVGWGTNVLALKMTFYPLDFIGVGKIGWQGIIPSKAAAMAGKAVDILTTKLITTEDRFSKIDPHRVAEEMEPAMIRLTERIIDEALEAQAPLLWETAPPLLKSRVYQQASDDLPKVVEAIMSDVKTNITELFDLRGMVIRALEEDRDLLNQIFLRVGRKEFRFIERSGLYFGFLFGLIQMVFWIFFHGWWILPLAGLLIGWATNYLALRLIFLPKEPTKIGFWTFQGMFIKRQKEVSAEYARIVSERILTSQNIFSTLIQGPASDRLVALVHMHVKKAVDTAAGLTKPLFQLAQGTQKYISIKQHVANRFVEELPHSIRHIFGYAEEALDIENTLSTRMQALSPGEFEEFLHPIFQEDEWKLILVGAVLGAAAGVGQLFLLFAERVL